MIRGIRFVRSVAAVGIALSCGIAAAAAKNTPTCRSKCASRTASANARNACIESCSGKSGGPTGSHSAKPAKGGKPKPVDPHAPPLDATTLACNEEYEANQAAIDGAGQSRAKFIKDCKNGTETIPGGAAPAAAPAADDKPAQADKPVAAPAAGRPPAAGSPPPKGNAGGTDVRH